MTHLRIIRRGELTTGRWSGGTTTQLAIWPVTADYGKRNFTWRVSSARVDAPESEFTALPGVDRILMILDGELFIEHEGHHSARLGRYDQDAFDGGWTTRSRGCVTDFNLMVRGGRGAVEKFDVQAGETVAHQCPPAVGVWKLESRVYYFPEGALNAALPGGGSCRMEPGDVIVAHSEACDAGTPVRLSNPTDAPHPVIVASILHNE